MNHTCPRCYCDNFPVNQKRSSKLYVVYEYICFRCNWKYSKKTNERMPYEEENAVHEKRR